MQLDPRNSNRSTPARCAEDITFTWMRRLSARKSAGAVAFAMMPPTFAAARTTTSGLASAKNPSTAIGSRRSTSDEAAPIRSVKPSACSCRHTAEPTMPLWPAT